jgi:hypothetical protein
MGEALHDIVRKHMSLVHPDFIQGEPKDETLARMRRAFESQGRLADLIENGEGEAAERHWRAQLVDAASYWLSGPGRTGTLDILD